MKLLFDENLPPKLAGSLAEQFPGSAHLRKFGLVGATDETVWEYAKENGFTIVSKDSDTSRLPFIPKRPSRLDLKPLISRLAQEKQRIQFRDFLLRQSNYHGLACRRIGHH